MKVLLLTLLLSLVCADLSMTDRSQLSGEWKTLYLASSNPVMTRKGGPFRGFVRKINFDQENGDILFDVYFREKGECVEKLVPGTRTEGHVFLLDYMGTILTVFTDVSEDSLVGYFINVDDNNVVSTTTFISGKSNLVNQQDFEKFKELTRKMDIPEANIVNMINLDYVLRNGHIFSMEPDRPWENFSSCPACLSLS